MVPVHTKYGIKYLAWEFPSTIHISYLWSHNKESCCLLSVAIAVAVAVAVIVSKLPYSLSLISVFSTNTDYDNNQKQHPTRVTQPHCFQPQELCVLANEPDDRTLEKGLHFFVLWYNPRFFHSCFCVVLFLSSVSVSVSFFHPLTSSSSSSSNIIIQNNSNKSK